MKNATDVMKVSTTSPQVDAKVVDVPSSELTTIERAVISVPGIVFAKKMSKENTAKNANLVFSTSTGTIHLVVPLVFVTATPLNALQLLAIQNICWNQHLVGTLRDGLVKTIMRDEPK